ncbi:hypothetical protein FJNA_07930 [Thermus sp. FJN-A]
MKRMLGFLLVSALALAAPLGGGLKVSSVFPPRSLPATTVLLLEDAKGLVVWQTGKGMLPEAAELAKVAYVVFALPQGKSYRYAVVGKAMSLEALQVRIGRGTYTLVRLLKDRHLALSKDGRLVAVSGKAATAHAPKKP